MSWFDFSEKKGQNREGIQIFFWGNRNHSVFYICKKEVEKVQLHMTPDTENNAEEENVEMENEQVEEGCEEMEIKEKEVLVAKAINEVKEENYEEGEEKEERKDVNCSFLCFPDRR